jgi:ABC-type dipeptide/oligopeptide/nickel transport system permease subunit
MTALHSASPEVRTHQTPAPPVRQARRALRWVQRNKGLSTSAAFLTAVVIAGVAAPWIAPYDPDAQVLSSRLGGFSSAHWLGTDDLGRDVLSRLLAAGRVSLYAAALATAVGFLLGVPAGVFSGYTGGWIDAAAGRFADALMSIPGLLLALAIVGALEPSLTNAMLAVGVVFAPNFFRLSRAVTLSLRQEGYVEAAVAMGRPSRSIILGHVLPNIVTPVTVQTSITLGFGLLAEASISFLGLGVQPPQASWGAMLGRSARYMQDAPHLVLVPGLMIF